MSGKQTDGAARQVVRRGHKLAVLGMMLLVSVAAMAQTLRAPLRIAAAADLEPLLPSILHAYAAESGVHATATYESSAALTAHILNGAGFDLFLSADMSYPERVIAAGMGATAQPVPYAQGVLVLYTRRDSRWPQPTVALLRDPALQRLAIADPARAPYGHAAMEAIEHLGLATTLQPKLVIASNIAQAAQFAETGNADAGLISQAAAMTPALRATGNFVAVPQSLYPAMQQGAVVLAHAAERVEAQRFLDFLLSPEMQGQLERSGLKAVRPAANPVAGRGAH